jgi:drug/metabolite transporter (DMT)-like permease
MFVKNNGIALVLLTAFISGFSIFVNKIGVKGIDPFIFTALKNSVTAILLLFVLFKKRLFASFLELKKIDYIKLLVIGLIGGAIPFLLFFKGLSLTNPAQASFWHKNMFLISIPFALVFLKEKLNRSFLLSAILLFAANLLLLQKININFQTGDYLVLLATISWTIENTFSKHLLKHIKAEHLAFSRMFFGTIGIFIFLAFTKRINSIQGLGWGELVWVLFTSFLLLAYQLTWYKGLKRIKLTTALAILLLGGPVTSILSLLFINQSLSLKQILASFFTIIGIMVLLIANKLVRILRQKKPQLGKVKA